MSSARAAAIAASALYALYRPGSGTTTGSNALATGSRRSISLDAPDPGATLYALPTYTAMLSLRELLVARGETGSAWA